MFPRFVGQPLYLSGKVREINEIKLKNPGFGSQPQQYKKHIKMVVDGID
jgi:hypothetical protein